jgi:hypothetical protein
MADDRPTCPRCQIGLLNARPLPFTLIENGIPLNVARMPALLCDICGYREFNRTSVRQLQMMAGLTRSRRARKGTSTRARGAGSAGSTPTPPSKK